ncbi:hypothetical protein KAFR_0I01390 [Kazachstania africana CBS 2517]|uniref:Nitrogen permease regulator 3 n=1 Tax=Kazachstania africana (strain ATCC 22294 / BCRC 22015 / CBS 2517 / CECT 1963 / NBRC 1671 / NRRL Y-8276) TaxID=1071382 RepID=H2AZX0_KAZAF|nr:hypothetical protein KAFR_0I01390 [Kazachstania africana CBS 2517]CCF59920.1 hypothetical protein KAFR_0I01390 [Kazachstania africana CBS 2517]
MDEFLPISYLLGVHLTISTHSGPQIVYSYPPSSSEYILSLQNVSYKFAKRKDQASKSTRKVKENASVISTDSDSSFSSSSSGLSGSEMSTDYADESFSSDEGNDEEITHDMSNLGISTDKLFRLFTNENGNADESDNSDEIDNSDLELDIKSKLFSDEDGFEFNETFFDEENYRDYNKLFGFDSEFVAEFCCPDRELCNSRFEFTVDDLCFLGLPIRRDASGYWRKSKRKKHTSKKSSSLSHAKVTRSSSNRSESSKRTQSSNTAKAYPNSNSDVEQENNEESLDKDDLERNMNMFHICFVLNPPLTEYNKRADDLYQYIVARLSILLRYFQAKNNYVSKECSIILKERENVVKYSKSYESALTPAAKAKCVYERILSKSSLARMLTKCVDKLHKNEIASIKVGDDKIISLQIPVKNEFEHLPNFKQNAILPNSYLTSILNKKFLEKASFSSAPHSSSRKLHSSITLGNSLILHDGDDDYDNEDDDILNYALLLLDDVNNILRTLETTTMNSTESNDINMIILRHLIKHIQPTVPLNSYHYIITDALDLEPSTVTYDILRSCALHLIYWRHARVIIPMSSKFTYVVSPIISLEKMYNVDKVQFKKRFPSLPTLSYFLSKLSGGKSSINTSKDGDDIKWPYSFNNIIPSREHKGIYLDVLSWLIRRGYVTQLLTFVYIRIDKRIKIAVDEDLEREGYRRGKMQKLQMRKINKSNRSTKIGDNQIAQKVDHRTNIENDNLAAATDKSNLEINKNDPITGSTEDIHFEFDDPEMRQDYTIILEPERATAIEKRWIHKCVSEQPPDIKNTFNKLLKYFNGRAPMELATLQEGISRHELKRLFASLDKHLVELHHW